MTRKRLHFNLWSLGLRLDRPRRRRSAGIAMPMAHTPAAGLLLIIGGGTVTPRIHSQLTYPAARARFRPPLRRAGGSLGGGGSPAASVSQSVISRSRPALTPPPARSPAPPLPVEHKYRVLAPGGYSIVASEAPRPTLRRPSPHPSGPSPCETLASGARESPLSNYKTILFHEDEVGFPPKTPLRMIKLETTVPQTGRWLRPR